MKKASILEIGTFLQIPIKDGSFGYGRVLSDPYIAFYNYNTEKPSSDLDMIDSQPILFIQAVSLFDYKHWKNIGKRELHGELIKPVVRFMQDLADFKKCVIFDSAGGEKQATPEECIGIERAEVWETFHIEQRLLDTFKGRSNEAEMHARVRLK